MIESIITAYLQHSRRLVIPGLGAFLKKEEGDVVFVPFLNKDDGILAGLVRKAYGTSLAEAQELIAGYVVSINRGIDDSGTFLVSPLGSLKRDGNGILFLDTTDLAPKQRPQKPVVPEAVPGVEAEDKKADELPAEEVVIVETIIEPELIPVPVIEVPEPAGTAAEDAPKTVAETIEAPKTLNDLIREKQQTEEIPQATIHTLVSEQAEQAKPQPRPQEAARSAAVPHRVEQKVSAPAPRRENTAISQPAKKEKPLDWVLIGAIAIALVAIVAMIYAYAVVDLPIFNLR